MATPKHSDFDHAELAKRLAIAVTSCLIRTLRSIGPFTVFAPTSQAFVSIQEDIDSLLKPENKKQFDKVLTGHVVAGKLMAETFRDGQELTTVASDKLKVSIINGTIIVGGATVTYPNVAASNGVIHVIDKLMIPFV